MGRSTRHEYLTTADYAFDWGDNLGRMSTGHGGSDAEAYAARVHDWHVSVDRVNRNLTRTNASWRLGYSPWLDASGPKLASCPGCGADLGVLV